MNDPTTGHPLRFIADFEGELAVLHVGFRINRLLQVGKWWPVAAALPGLIRETRHAPGLLGSKTFWSGRMVMVTQYWTSAQTLEVYARDGAAGHRWAWRRFNQAARGSGAVGIFHETFIISADRSESVYVDMPPEMLAAATGVAPVQSPRPRLTPKRLPTAPKGDASRSTKRAPP